MSTRVLVPLTDSTHSWPGLEHAFERFPDGEITVLNVIDPAGAGYGEQTGGENGSIETQIEELFGAANELAGKHGRSIDTATAEGRPAETIVGFAEREAIDGIVMGSRGRSGVSRVLLGSVAGTVVQDSSVPVTVVP